MARSRAPRTTPAADQSTVSEALAGQFRWLDYQAEAPDPAVRRKALHHLEDAGQTEARTQSDYVGRFAIELLQNAHDACADAGREGAVRFVLTASALLVANEGRPFDGPRIDSLVRQGSSEKAEAERTRRTIGYKGVGFSSVFEISDRPQVISTGDARFQFDRDRASDLVRAKLARKPKRVAARAFPFALEDSDLGPDAEAVGSLLAAGAVTVIRLPVRAEVGLAQVKKTILETLKPQVLVFMPAVNELELQLGSVHRLWKRRFGQRYKQARVIHLDGVDPAESSWLTRELSVNVTPDEAHALGEPAWQRVRRAEFTVGLPWRGGVSLAERLSPVHVYFPTEESTGRSVLLHGDFVVDSRRAQIQHKGAAGELNRKFAAHAAAGLADLAQQFAVKYSPQVCAALAESGEVSAFGRVFNEFLVGELQSRRLVVCASSDRPVVVTKARRSTSLGFEWEERLLSLVRKKAGLLAPIYRAERSRVLLDELGVKSVSPELLAKRLRVPATPVANQNALVLLGEWVDELHYLERARVLGVLKDLAILRDTDGVLRRADEVVLSVGSGPALPPLLRKRQLAPLVQPRAVELADELDVDHLDAAGALAALLEALSDGRYGRKAAEHMTALRFCRNLWDVEPRVVKDVAADLGALRLPVRKGGQRTVVNPSWRPASETYLGSGWHELGETLERLYGPLGEPEFLAEPPPDSPGERRRSREFFHTIGAASAPREVDVDARTATHYYDWWRDPQVQAAQVCDNDHPESRRITECVALDRLDDLLNRVGRDGGALAETLAALPDPYGKSAEIRCGNSTHHGNARPKRAPGYQQWRLERVAWVPVRNDPHERRHRRPKEAWTGVPRAGSSWWIPAVSLPDPPPSLRFVTWQRARTEDVETALSLLKTSKLSTAECAPTADVLLTRLEITTARSTERREPVAVLCHQGDRRSWSDAPLIPDLPRLHTLDGIDVLPPGSWANARRAYGWSLASEVVEQQVRVKGAPLSVEPMLPPRQRARLLALVARQATDLVSLATRLKRLREHHVSAFELRLSVAGTKRSTSTLSVHLVEAATPRTRLPTGDLYLTPQFSKDFPVLVQLLGHYLRLEDPSALGFFLKAPDDALETYGITKAEIDEAAELLRKRRAASTERPAFEVIEPAVESPTSEGTQADVSEPPESPAAEAATNAPTTKKPPASTTAGTSEPPKTPRRSGSTTVAAETDHLEFGEPVLMDPATPPAQAPSPAAETIPPVSSPQESAKESSGRTDAATETELDSDKETESAAVKIVCDYARSIGVVEIRDVQSQNKGWDLEFVFDDGTEQMVEVKGSRASAAFVITRNELKQAKRRSDYVLYFVFDLGAELPRMARIDQLGTRATDERLAVYQWTVPGWRDMEPVEIPISTGAKP